MTLEDEAREAFERLLLVQQTASGWGPHHRHFASDEIRRDADCACGSTRRVWVFDTDILQAHEEHLAQRATDAAVGRIRDAVTVMSHDAQCQSLHPVYPFISSCTCLRGRVLELLAGEHYDPSS